MIVPLGLAAAASFALITQGPYIPPTPGGPAYNPLGPQSPGCVQQGNNMICQYDDRGQRVIMDCRRDGTRWVCRRRQ